MAKKRTAAERIADSARSEKNMREVAKKHKLTKARIRVTDKGKLVGATDGLDVRRR